MFNLLVAINVRTIYEISQVFCDVKNFDKYLKCLGSRIRSLRQEAEVNQKLFSSNIGIDDRHLRRIEKGETNPTIETLYKIASQLKISLSELLKDISE